MSTDDLCLRNGPAQSISVHGRRQNLKEALDFPENTLTGIPIRKFIISQLVMIYFYYQQVKRVGTMDSNSRESAKL